MSVTPPYTLCLCLVLPVFFFFFFFSPIPLLGTCAGTDKGDSIRHRCASPSATFFLAFPFLFFFLSLFLLSLFLLSLFSG